MGSKKECQIKIPRGKVIRHSLRRKRAFPNVLQMIAGVPAMSSKKSAKESVNK